MARFPMTAPEAFLPPDLRGDEAPNVMDNLAASATPIAVEPTARKKRDLRQEQIDRLVAAGDDPQTAAMVVDRLREINGGEIPAGLFDSYNTPEGNAALAKRIADGKVANARMAAFERNYNAETGHPEYGYDEAGNAAKLGRVNIDNPSAVEQAGKRARAYNFNAPYNSEMESLNNSMSDERRAQIAADFDAAVAAKESRWARGEEDSLAQNQAEREKYGTGANSEVTKDQAAARYERKVAEDKMRQHPSVVEARLKRMAAAAGISMSEARASYEAGMEENGGGETFDEFRRGTQDLRDKATDRRLAAQQAAKDNWRATAMLAGGSQNINSGNRAIYDQAAAIDDPAKQAEFLSQFRQTPGNFQSNDPRIQVAQIQAEAAKANAAAEREGRNSQNQWLETTRIADEERARAAQMFDATKRQEFDAEQKRLEREFTAAQGDKAREDAVLVREQELEQRRQEHAERMAAEERRYQLSREENAAREKAAELRHAETLEAMRGDSAARTAGAAATVEGARITAGAATEEADAKRDAAAEQQRMAMELGLQEKSPGLYDVMTGNPSTEDAIRELKRIAASADRFQYFPGGGFGAREAESMNDHLKRLQRQAEVMGIESPLADPEYRRELIKQWGYSSGWAGGRGGWMGDWFNPMPEDLQ